MKRDQVSLLAQSRGTSAWLATFSPCCGSLEAHVNIELLSAWLHKWTKFPAKSIEEEVHFYNIKSLGFRGELLLQSTLSYADW